MNHCFSSNSKTLLNCNKFRPLPNITWNKLNGELPFTRLKDFKSQETDYGKALIIENIRPEDEGIYECRSQHLFHQMHVTIIGNLPMDYFKTVNI